MGIKSFENMSETTQLPLCVVVGGTGDAPVFAVAVAAVHPVCGPAVTYATYGLLRYGQRELLWTFAGAPPDLTIPLHVFQAVAREAAHGNIVVAGGLTELGRGLFRDDLVGIAYGPANDAHAMDDADAFADSAVQYSEPEPLSSRLRMHMLTRVELEAAKRFGVSRVLARLGRQARFFPFPSCDDLRRASSIDDAELTRSMLKGVAVVDGIAGFIDDDEVTVRVRADAAAGVAGAIAATNVATFNLQVDSCDALHCMVWSPGASGPQAISGSAVSGKAPPGLRIAGCFASFVQGRNDDDEGTVPIEDGFVVCVAPSRWRAFLDSITAGRDIHLMPRAPGRLATHVVFYAGDDVARRAPRRKERIEIASITLRTPEDALSRNTTARALSELTERVASAARGALVNVVPPGGRDLPFDVDIVVQPAGKPPLYTINAPALARPTLVALEAAFAQTAPLSSMTEPIHLTLHFVVRPSH